MLYVVQVLSYDPGGFEGVFSTSAKAQAWIDSQPRRELSGWRIVPVELDVPFNSDMDLTRRRVGLMDKGHRFEGMPLECVRCGGAQVMLLAFLDSETCRGKYVEAGS